jgi:hypothetical protein
MALNQSPKIITDGLVFYYDMTNGKSFIGGPVTNTLPTPAVNGLPTYGNGWATYNTNQYNGNAYFSIGSISSVTSNIVTTSGNHPLRSYDVVTPQTTGGGVTAGTNYLIKKLSNTSFTLHTYNSSQDGSEGYINPATGNHKVYDDFSNDVRVSVNASSFPTMWWGPPHLPNSALVKEIIPQGFNGIPGRPATDCVRLHFNRTDATDGMAYGPDASVTAGVLHTVTFWARSVTASAVGTTGSYQIYNYGATTPTGYSIGYTLGPVGVWQRYILQFTPNNPLAISYWFPGGGGQKHDIANIQFEVGSVANSFAPGTRSNTQAIRDLTNNNTITASALTYNSDNTFSFNGSNQFINCGTGGALTLGNNGAFTASAWIRISALKNYSGIISKVESSRPGTYSFMCCAHNDGTLNFYNNSSWYYSNNVGITTNTWYNVAFSFNGSTMSYYVNGVAAGTSALTWSETTAHNVFVGSWYSPNTSYDFNGTIANAQLYNRGLSAAEVQQNFQALRGRYGL